jgi:hypothetical protein
MNCIRLLDVQCGWLLILCDRIGCLHMCWGWCVCCRVSVSLRSRWWHIARFHIVHWLYIKSELRSVSKQKTLELTDTHYADINQWNMLQCISIKHVTKGQSHMSLVLDISYMFHMSFTWWVRHVIRSSDTNPWKSELRFPFKQKPLNSLHWYSPMQHVWGKCVTKGQSHMLPVSRYFFHVSLGFTCLLKSNDVHQVSDLEWQQDIFKLTCTTESTKLNSHFVNTSSSSLNSL